MGIYLADFGFDTIAPPDWQTLFERVRFRFGAECSLSTHPDPGRREHARLSTPSGDDIHLHRHDGLVSVSHGPQVRPFARAVHRTLADFGGQEAGRNRAVLRASEPPPSLAAIAKRLEQSGWGRVRREEHATLDPPLVTCLGPLLAEGFFTLQRAKTAAAGESLRFEVRIHHRAVVVEDMLAPSPVFAIVVGALNDLGCR